MNPQNRHRTDASGQHGRIPVTDRTSRSISSSWRDAEEERFWRERFDSLPYVDGSLEFDDYAPAYRLGWQSRIGDGDSRRTFDDAESDLRSAWERVKAESRLTWEKARDAVRDGWDRMSDRRRDDACGCADEDATVIWTDEKSASTPRKDLRGGC